MRQAQEGDVVEVIPTVAYPGTGVVIKVLVNDQYAYFVRIFRPQGDFKVSVSRVYRCVVNFAGVVRL